MNQAPTKERLECRAPFSHSQWHLILWDCFAPSGLAM